MILDYTDRLNRIAKSAGMFDFTRFRPLYPTKKAFNKYIAVLDKYFEERKLPIRLIVGDEKSIGYIIKMCPSLEGVEVCNFEEIKDKDLSGYKECTIFIIGNNILKVLWVETDIYNKHPNCRVCSIFEYMEYNGVIVRYPFWQDKESLKIKLRTFFKYILSYERLNRLANSLFRIFKFNKNLIVYLPSFLQRELVFCTNKAYRSGYLDDKEREILLKKLMGFSVLEKDILGLKKHISSYVEFYDESYKDYIIEIDKIVLEMKDNIARRTQKDVILNWVDMISNNRLKEEMPFLYQLSQKKGSMKSEFAYTCMPYTTPTLKTILTGKDPIEGRLFDYKLLNDEMNLLKQLKKNNYRFLCFGDVFWENKTTPRKYRGISADEQRTNISTEYLWNAFNYLATSNNKPVFLLIHGIYETHGPWFCPDSDELRGANTKKNQQIASAWMDKQYEFYNNVMGEKSLQIYMGDHGLEGSYIYENNRCNVMFFVRNSDVLIDFTKGLFSLKKFPQLIGYLMKWNNLTEDDLLDESAKSCMYDYYGLEKINNVLKDSAELRDKNSWMQCKVIRNKKYTYVLYFDGEEMFYALPNETENLIDRPEYADIIQEMRQKLGTEFIDIYKEEYFVHSRKLYEAYAKIKDEKSL